MAGITVKIAGVDRTEYIDARSFGLIDEITNRASSAYFDFICKDVAIAPVAGNSVLIEENGIKLFSGRVLGKEGEILNPNQLKYAVECIDHTRDLDKILVIKSYTNTKGGDIIKDIIDTYTTGFTYVNVQDGPTLNYISFDYVQVSEAITQIAEACGYQWYIDYDKDLYFFLKTDYPAAFQLDDDQEHYKELVLNYDISQLRNRVYVKSSKYETSDFTELFVGDGAAVTWACKYAANPLPHPTLELDGIVKTVGWDGVDDPDLFDFMLNITTKVLSLGTFEGTPGVGEEIVVTYGADVPIMIRWDDEDSIAAVVAIEGGDGIHEFCITDNNIDTKEWAIDRAKADLLENADPVIQGSFLTNEKTIRSGQIITLSSVKRDITQDFLVQRVELIRIDAVLEDVGGASVPFKAAAGATVAFKPAVDAVVPFKPAVEYGMVVYYVYQVTIATKLKGLEDLLLQLLYQSSESLKRDTIAPDVPTGLALTTGMGEITQAGLAWLKATYDANTEVDFSHYELKYKKTAYSDFGYVSTTDVTYIWTGLEQNVEYEVYIRAVDIYGNRSAWSSQVLKTTAIDTEAPVQITGAVATPVLAGIKVTWDGATEGDIAGYIVERQESDDGTTWITGWVEMTRINASMWLDLLLPYIKFYRYRITAYTHTGTEGVTSSPTADSIAPLKTGANDIVAKCITADQIFGNKLSVIFADMGTITAGTITLNTTGFIRSVGKEYGGATAGFWMGYAGGAYKFHIGTQTKYLKWDGANLDVKGNIVITGGSGIANLLDAGALATLDNIAYAAVTGAKPPTNADNTLSNPQGYPWIAGAKPPINADNTASHPQSVAWLTNAGNLAYYNQVSAALLDSTIIIGGFIKTSLLTATNIRTGTLRSVRIQIGGGTNEDIYFEDSGVRMYDAGGRTINIYKAGYKYLQLALGGTAGVLNTDGKLQLSGVGRIELWASSRIFHLHSTGTLQIPYLTSQPSAHSGDLALKCSGGGDSDNRMHYYSPYVGWQYLDDSAGW